MNLLSVYCLKTAIYSARLQSVGTIVKVFVFSGAGPELSTQNLLQSIAAALHLSGQPVTGQPATKSVINKNPGVHINTNQPHIEVKNFDFF